MNPLIVLGIRILEGMFVVGAVGSAVVLLLAGVEDVQTLFNRGD